MDEPLYLGNTLMQWSLAAGAVLVALGVGLPVRAFLRRRAKDDKASAVFQLLGHLAQRVHTWFLLILGFYVGVNLSDLAPEGYALNKPWLDHVFAFALYAQGALLAIGLMRYYLRRYRKRKREAGDMASVSALNFIALGGQCVIWAIALLLIIDNLGHDVTALVAGLGVGGIAIALAVQNILSDLFASLTIVLDKPFVVGDFIIIDNHLGSVEHIGLKTTRIRSLSGEQLIFSNGDLLSSRIRNFKRMEERRVVFSLGVTYQTKSDKLALIPKLVRETIEKQDKVRFDRAHFQKYGDFALLFEIVYWVLEPDYNVYMDIQQAVNLEIYQRFEAEGIEFAYPTQTLYLNRESMPTPTDATAQK